MSRTASRSAGRYVAWLTQREVPPGLTKQEAKILRKVRSRAHYLDKGFNLCGLRFGWTFIIGLIPLVGDLTDAFLNHQLVVKKAQQVEGYVAYGLTQYSRLAHSPHGHEQLGVARLGLCASGG